MELNVSSREACYVPNLDPDERQVLVETCRHKDVFGNLFLTNKRLLFEHVSGIFTKRVYVTLDLRLEGVSSVSAEGTIGKKLVIYAKSGFVSGPPPLSYCLCAYKWRWSRLVCPKPHKCGIRSGFAAGRIYHSISG